MKLPTLALLAGLFASRALSSAIQARKTSYPSTLSFDDGGYDAPAAIGLPVRRYKGVQFDGINVVNHNASTSVKVNSPPNTAVIAFRTLIAVTPAPPFVEIVTPKLSIDYDGSPFESFDVLFGYFGCGAMTGISVSAPVNCEIRFSAVKRDGHVEDMIVSFQPKKSLDPEANEDMKLVKFGDEFKGIKEMRVALESSQLPLGILSTAIVLDSFNTTMNKR